MALPDLPTPDAPEGEYVASPDLEELGFHGVDDAPLGQRGDGVATDGEEIDTRMVRRLADILKETDLTEIEVERGELKIRVARQGALVAVPTPQPSPMMAPPASVTSPAPLAASTEALRGEQVKSPMVGTVYLQAQPGSKRFVQAGEQVTEGQTLLIIEAMKTMNPVPAPKAGTVVKVLVEDGQPVEFGEPLIVVD